MKDLEIATSIFLDGKVWSLRKSPIDFLALLTI